MVHLESFLASINCASWSRHVDGRFPEVFVTLCSYLILETLDDLFVVQLENLYDVELRLTGALPGLADAAGSERLKAVFRDHLHAAMSHVHMLEDMLKIMELDFHRKSCETIQYLLSQAEDVLGAPCDPELKIAALTVIARRVHHYKIAAYTSLRNLARRSGRPDLVKHLQQAVEAEIEAEKRLTKIAEFSADRDMACSPA